MSLLAHGIVDFNFQIPSNTMYFFSFLAITFLQSNKRVHLEKRQTVWDDKLFDGENGEIRKDSYARKNIEYAKQSSS